MRLSHAATALSLVALMGLSACSTSTPSMGQTSGSDQGPASASSSTRTDASASPGTAGAASSAEVPKGDGTKVIYMVSMGFQHRYWQAVKEGAERAGKEFGYKVTFVGPDDETKVTQQLDQLKTALDSKPAAIGLAALDGGAAEPLLNQIDAAGIPLVCFDSGVASKVPRSTVMTDNVAAAEEAAKHMVELTGGKGTVGLVCHDQTSQVGKERCEGFQAYMKQNAPDMKLLQPLYANEVGAAANTTKSIVQANPDVVGIYGTNEAAASGAVQGKAESGKTDLVVVGFDSGKTQLEAIRSGVQAGAVTQAPVRMGYETVVAAARAIAGQEIPEVVDSGFKWYDKSNVEAPEVAANLYE